MLTGVEIFGLLAVLFVAWLAFKIVKSFLKTLFIGLLLLVLVGGWILFNHGFF
jgi:hypothetical protein